ncbi:ParB/RepB/Spo0J family partition protein [Butyrivibrio sp. LC3010]|uniref:ParB/RepB/Spo0J family partition protein n=1 Tax=Butyrivibrio sp. LC3010 TaxID=1280680 RepID=UPI0003F4E152|nr:ParB N-terminal domain-containing protein [Butyrivibrio sp. LC3010]
MSDSTGFSAYLKSELEKYKGVYVPVKASPLESILFNKVSVKKLHPNPNDEFCIDSVGPSYRIISEYQKKFREDIARNGILDTEPLMVEKVRPDGYMILNGHHRWAAAIIAGIEKMPVNIVNLTKPSDIIKMLEKSDRNKRVTFDLDEIIFASEEDRFEDIPSSLDTSKFPEKVRLGVPALFHFFHSRGYDVWVFSSKYYSMDYIKKLFKKYSVDVDGIVTGTARKLDNTGVVEKKKTADQLIANKYKETISVDNDSVLRTYSGSKEFDHFDIPENDERWSAKVMKIVEEAIANEQQ